MKTDPVLIRRATEVLQRGGVVVVPTETVYGLAANAMDPTAVGKVFVAKGRPDTNPLIVHVLGIKQAQELCIEWPEVAQRLAQAFWPGPLTLILPKRDAVPAITTAGLSTIAIRSPRHQIFRALLEASGLALAAPSANLYTRLSPTRFEDLDQELLRRVDMALDGGDCEVGIESTVVDLCHGSPKVMRPGVITQEEIDAVAGESAGLYWQDESRSPGAAKRHYAPKYQVRLVKRASDDAVALVLGEARGPKHISMPEDEQAYASRLYAVLAELDRTGVNLVEIERPPDNWTAVLDRLNRATA